MVSITRIAPVLIALALTACSATDASRSASFTPEVEVELATREKRLMEPFGKGHTVLCKNLEIVTNPLFFKHLTFPAGKPRRQKLPDAETMTWSVLDDVATRRLGKALKPYQKLPSAAASKRGKHQKFKIMIGSTVFMVDDRVTIRSLRRAAPTMTALASGHVLMIQDGKTANTYQQIRYSDGRVDVR